MGQLLIKGVSVGAPRASPQRPPSACSTQNRTLLFLFPRWGFSPCRGFVTAAKGLTQSLEHSSPCSPQRLWSWQPFCGQCNPPLPRHPAQSQWDQMALWSTVQQALHSTFANIKIGPIASRGKQPTLKMESSVVLLE